MRGHSKIVTSVALNNDGSKLATGSGDETVRIWAVGSAGTYDCESTLTFHRDHHYAPVGSVCFSPCGKNIVSGGGEDVNQGSPDDFWIRIEDAKTGTCQFYATVDSSVYSVAFSPDGSRFAAAHSTEISIFDAQTQAKVGSRLSGHRYPPKL